MVMSDKFKFELIPLRMHSSGCILFFGYPLFGGWIPFIGFTTIWDSVYEEEVKVFLIEWLCIGIAIEAEKKDNE